MMELISADLLDAHAGRIHGTDGAFAASSNGLQVQVSKLHEPSSCSFSLDIVGCPITALAVSSTARLASSDEPHYGRSVVVVATSGSVVAANLEEAAAAHQHGHHYSPPTVLHSGEAEVQHMCLSPDGVLLALCIDNAVGIIDLQTLQVVYRLESSSCAVVAAAFNPHSSNQLAAITSDRRLMVWDLQEGLLLHQSSQLTSAPVTSLSFDPTAPKLAVGAADGLVMFLDLSSLPACRCLQVVDMGKAVFRMVLDAAAASEAAGGSAAALPSGPKVIKPGGLLRRLMDEQAAAMAGGIGSTGPGDSLCSIDVSVLSLYHSPIKAAALESSLPLLAQAPVLLVGTPEGLLAVDCHTYGVKTAILYSAQDHSAWGTIRRCQHVPDIPLARSYSFGVSPAKAVVICCVDDGRRLHTMQLRPAGTDAASHPPHESASTVAEDTGRAAGQQPSTGLSIYQQGPLPPTSPLALALHGRRTSSSDTTAATGRASTGSMPSTAAMPASGTTGSTGRRSWADEADTAAAGRATGKGSSTTASSSRPPPGGAARTPAAGKGSAGSSKAAGSKPSSNKKPGQLVDKPLTFHSKIRSSGYGMVQPKMKIGCSKPAAKPVATRPAAPTALGRHITAQLQYPSDCAPLVQHDQQLSAAWGEHKHNGAVVQLSYSPECTWLATASADGTAHVVRCSSSGSGGSSTTLVGHKGPLRCANWSHDATLLVTTAADKTVRLWSPVQPAALLQLEPLSGQQQSSRPDAAVGSSRRALGGTGSSSAGSGSSSSSGGRANSEVTWAQFAYMDELLLVAAGNQLQSYRYSLPCGQPDDIKRYQQRGKCNKIASYSSPSQALLAASSINACPSTLAICAGTNRSLELVDLATMACVATINDAHDRPVHSIAQLGPSPYTSHNREAHELFATAAQDGTIKVWDVRSAAAVRVLTGHKSAQLTRLGMAFSPCLRYLCCGSEEAAWYMYDLRQAVGMAHVREGIRHDSWVADVAYHPLRAQLAVGCMDGSVQLYREPSGMQ